MYMYTCINARETLYLLESMYFPCLHVELFSVRINNVHVAEGRVVYLKVKYMLPQIRQREGRAGTDHMHVTLPF